MIKLNEEYIKVRDAKAGETGWARVEGDKIFLNNDFANYEVGQEIKVNDEGEIIWAGPTLEQRVKALDEDKKAEKLAENKKIVGAEFVRSPNSATTRASKLIVQLLLYLCAANADVKERRPSSLTTAKKATKTTDKRPVRHWDVGVHIGATIKANRRSYERTGGTSAPHGTHARPRPHLRRGHWSHFWTGKRDSANRERILKWIEPVYINADSPDDLPTTIHRVK